MAKKKKQIDFRVVIAGIICLTALEICAMLKGHNGFMLRGISAIIAIAIGVVIENPFKK